MSEAARLARLRELLVLDSAHEPIFDRLARMASTLCGTPIALVSLIDEERQWFKANVGLPGVNEAPRDVAFCNHTIAGDEIFEVPDASRDSRFAANPLVTGDPDIRFYAGAPLVLQSGARVGTLCVIDRQPRHLDEAQRAMLLELAGLVTEALEMRRGLLAKSLVTRGKVQEALLQSEAQYRAIVEDQTEMISVASAAGELEFVNRSYAAHLGAAPEALIGRSLFDFVDAADREGMRKRIAEVVAGGKSFDGEIRMRDAQGGVRWVSWTNRIYRDASGHPSLLSVGREVTDRKRAEIELRTSQSLLTRIGRVAGVGGWELDMATQQPVWTDETKRIHEVSSDYVPQLASALDFYTAESRPRIEQAVALGMRTGTPWDLELQMITARGKPIWVRAVGEVEFESGQPVRLTGAFQDITTRKELETRVVESERFLRQITDSLPLRIAYVDRTRRYRFVNHAHVERFGMAREAILGRTHEELLGAAAGEGFWARVAGALSGEAQRFEFEEPAEGGPRRMESRLTPDIDATGQVHGFFSTSVDVTERAQTEQALRDLSAIVERTTDFIVQVDWRGNILYMNPAVREAAGIAASEAVTGRNFAEFNTDETNRRYTEEILPAVHATGVWLGETTVFAAGGRVIPVSHQVIAHRNAGGRVDRYSAVMRDITAEVGAKRELQRQTATLRSVAAAVPAMICVVGTDGVYRFVNDAFERWIGSHRDSIVGSTAAQVLGQPELERSRASMARVLGGESVAAEEISIVRGQERHLATSYSPLWLPDGRIDGYIKVAHDITSHRVEHRRLAQLSERDALTGLLNRAGFESHLRQSLDSGGASTLAMLCIDLDHFKAINDGHGHMAGDHVLRTFSQRVINLVRPTDAVCRLGGDEFVIVMHGLRNDAGAAALAQKVLRATDEPVVFESHLLRFGASVGIARGADPEDGWQGLYARADAMLYCAKSAGRGRASAEPRDDDQTRGGSVSRS